jgi:hypothetical protein
VVEEILVDLHHEEVIELEIIIEEITGIDIKN